MLQHKRINIHVTILLYWHSESYLEFQSTEIL